MFCKINRTCKVFHSNSFLTLFNHYTLDMSMQCFCYVIDIFVYFKTTGKVCEINGENSLYLQV